MVALQFVTDSKDKKIPPVSYKDVLVGRDEKKVSDKKETVNEASFDGLKDVDSFASSEATLTEEYFDMYAQILRRNTRPQPNQKRSVQTPSPVEQR